jgi:hypothetical protein
MGTSSLKPGATPHRCHVAGLLSERGPFHPRDLVLDEAVVHTSLRCVEATRSAGAQRGERDLQREAGRVGHATVSGDPRPGCKRRCPRPMASYWRRGMGLRAWLIDITELCRWLQ